MTDDMAYNDNNGDKKKWYDVNKLEISGRCGRDPEYKTSANGKDICRFSVAMSEKGYGGGDDKTTWLNVTLFGATCEASRQKNLAKGDIVKLRGKLDVREWTDNDGNKRKDVGMVAFEIATGRERLPDPKPYQPGGQGEQRHETRQEPQRREQSSTRQAENAGSSWEDPDIPF